MPKRDNPPDPHATPPQRRRIPYNREPLTPPPGEPPGPWWANRPRRFGPTRLEELREHIRALSDPENGSPQAAVELFDEGEPTPFGGAGDFPPFLRDPWDSVVWIGPPERAEDVILRMLEDPTVWAALCRGADIRVTPRGEADLETQRAEAEAIRRRLAEPPGPAAPAPDQAAYHATRAAHATTPPPAQISADDTAPGAGGSEGAGPRGNTAKDPWPPDDGWHTRPGEFAVGGRRYAIAGKCWKLLDVFLRAHRPLTKAELMDEVWGDEVRATSTVSSTLTKVRNVLRRALQLPTGFDPLPRVDRGDLVAWRLDRDGMYAATRGSAENQQRLSSPTKRP